MIGQVWHSIEGTYVQKLIYWLWYGLKILLNIGIIFLGEKFPKNKFLVVVVKDFKEVLADLPFFRNKNLGSWTTVLLTTKDHEIRPMLPWAHKVKTDKNMPLKYILHTKVANYVKIMNLKGYLILGNTSKRLQIVLRRSMNNRKMGIGSFFLKNSILHWFFKSLYGKTPIARGMIILELNVTYKLYVFWVLAILTKVENN